MTERATYGVLLTYQYDGIGRRTRITHPDGFYAQYSYNVGSQLTGISDSTGTTLASYAYDDQGRRTGYGFDAAGRLATLNQDIAGTSYDDSRAFSFNPAGQIASRTITNSSAYSWSGTTAGTTNTSHNGLNPVTTVSRHPLHA
jgi:YD repeat-containing protein